MDCGRSVKHLRLQPNIVPQGCRWPKTSSSASMATLSYTQWWFVRPKSTGDHQGVVWVQSFPLLGHPSLAGRASRLEALCQAVWSAAVYWLLAANLYMHIYIHTLIHIHVYTILHIYLYTYVCTHLYRSIHPPAILDLPTRHTVGASYLFRL